MKAHPPLLMTYWNARWDAHWGVVLAGYGLTLLTLTVLLASSLLRFYRAKKRLSLLESLNNPPAPDTPNPPIGRKKD